MSPGHWVGLAVTLGLIAGLLSYLLDVPTRIARRWEAARFRRRLPDHYNEQDWT